MPVDLPMSPAGMRAPVMLVDGSFFDAANPRPENVPEPWVLGHALARINRFAGHAKITTNVAHHSLVVATLAIAQGKADWCVLGCLLHDVGEAFVGDIPKPVKELLEDHTDVLAAIERCIVGAIADAYGLHPRMPDVHAVHELDRLALSIEARNVLARPDQVVKYWGLPGEDAEPTADAVTEALRRLGLARSLKPSHPDYVAASAAAWTNAVQIYRDQVRGS